MNTIKVGDKLKLAQKRNYFKYIITGIPKPVDRLVLSDYESEQWDIILKARENILNRFDVTSKQAGLNVPEHKCWCGKEGKYKPEYETFNNIEFVCKKHIKDEYNNS